MTCLHLCILFNIQICGISPPVFMNIFFRSRLTLYKCVVSAFIQRSWRILNWTISNTLKNVNLIAYMYISKIRKLDINIQVWLHAFLLWFPSPLAPPISPRNFQWPSLERVKIHVFTGTTERGKGKGRRKKGRRMPAITTLLFHPPISFTLILLCYLSRSLLIRIFKYWKGQVPECSSINIS